MNSYISLRLTTVDDVKGFVALANHLKHKITLLPAPHYEVQGSSLMGLFTIDTSRPVEARCAGVLDPDEREMLAPYLVGVVRDE